MKNIAIIGGNISAVAVAYFLDRVLNSKSKKFNISIIEKKEHLSESNLSKFQYGQEIYDNGWYSSVRNVGPLFQLILELGLYKYLIKSKKKMKVIYDNSEIKTFPEKMFFSYPLDKIELLHSNVFTILEKISLIFNLYKYEKIKNINSITIEEFFLKKINKNVYYKVIEPLLTSYYGSDISNQNFSIILQELSLIAIQNKKLNKILENMYNKQKDGDIYFGEEYRLKFTLTSIMENLESYFGSRVFIDLKSKVEEIEKINSKYVLTINNNKYIYDYLIVSTNYKEFLHYFKNDRVLCDYYKNLSYNSGILLTIICEKGKISLNTSIGEIIFNKNSNKNITNIEYFTNKWTEIKVNNIDIIKIYVKRQDKVKNLLLKSDKEIINILINELKEIHGDFEYKDIFLTKKIEDNIMINKDYQKNIDKINKHISENYPNMYLTGMLMKNNNLADTIIEAKEIVKKIIDNM